jgi:MoxR-like ATPase
MNLKSPWTFYGLQEQVRSQRHPGAPTKAVPYLPAKKLVEAVNLAIYLNRPLLLEGEAGCGKTQLAKAVAYELGVPFYPWYVRSTSKAREGLYTYDSLLRLYDVHAYQLQPQPGSEAPSSGGAQKQSRDPSVAANYVRYGPLGQAFKLADCPAVVLIDEIDKADLDFPNDLLTILDDPWMFKVEETGKKVTAKHKPIVIITSNKEKGNLPAPFLRRCLYYYVEFPEDVERLKQIVATHSELGDTKPPDSEVLDRASHRFIELRKDGGLHKKPGTSEFLDWLAILSEAHEPAEALTRLGAENPPHPELLFKLRADWQRFAATQ